MDLIQLRLLDIALWLVNPIDACDSIEHSDWFNTYTPDKFIINA